MDKKLLSSLDEQSYRRYLERQDMQNFHRVVVDNYETVKYLEDSSVRVWYNTEYTDYTTHWHPAVEIIMPLENNYTLTVGSEVYELSPGDILFIPSGELHSIKAPETGARLIYLFDFDEISKLNGFSFLMPFITQPILINEETCPQIYREEAGLLKEIFMEYFHETSLWELEVYSRLLQFFVVYGRFRISSDSEFAGSQTNKQRELTEKLNCVFDYIDEHFAEDVTLESAADVAGFSKFHFSRLFKQCSGQNFYDYLCYKRIRSAEMMLLRPELTVTEIALQSGFSSLSTFNRTFKRIKDCTPTEYRNLLATSAHKNL